MLLIVYSNKNVNNRMSMIDYTILWVRTINSCCYYNNITIKYCNFFIFCLKISHSVVNTAVIHLSTTKKIKLYIIQQWWLYTKNNGSFWSVIDMKCMIKTNQSSWPIHAILYEFILILFITIWIRQELIFFFFLIIILFSFLDYLKTFSS